MHVCMYVCMYVCTIYMYIAMYVRMCAVHQFIYIATYISCNEHNCCVSFLQSYSALNPIDPSNDEENYCLMEQTDDSKVSI